MVEKKTSRQLTTHYKAKGAKWGEERTTGALTSKESDLRESAKTSKRVRDVQRPTLALAATLAFTNGS